MFCAPKELIHQMNLIWDEELTLGGVAKEIWIKSLSNEGKVTLKLLNQKKETSLFWLFLQFNSFRMYGNVYNLNIDTINTI